jgi:hypothetical protein
MRRKDMKVPRNYLIVILSILLLSSVQVSAQEVPKVGQTGMKWLSIPIGARATALGGAYTSIANDLSSVFWNPAGVALTDGIHVFLNQTQWIADINVNAGAASFNAGTWGVIGVNVMAVDWGVFHGTRRSEIDPGGYIETGTFSPTSFAIGVNYAYRISEAFSIGTNFRYVFEELGSGLEGTWENPLEYTARMNLTAFDIGTLYYIGYNDLRLGMSLQNFSNEKAYRIDSFPLPLTFKFGLAMDVLSVWMHESSHKLTLATEYVHPRDYSERINVGLEYSLSDLVYLRGGYKFNYSEENLTFGVGLQFSIGGSTGLRLDYSYLPFDNFDAVHMFSFDFGI